MAAACPRGLSAPRPPRATWRRAARRSGLAPCVAAARPSARDSAASTAPAPPVPPPEPTAFQQFGRAAWPAFAVLQAVALVGAWTNGRLARKRRLEVEALNAKLRESIAASVQLSVDAAEDAPWAADRAAASELRESGDLQACAAKLRDALAAATADGDQDAVAELYGQLGDVQTDLGLFDDAAASYDQCLRGSSA